MEKLMTLWTGSGLFNIEPGQVIMIAIGLGLLYLAIHKRFEPLLLVPIGFGGILANIPGAGLALSAVDRGLDAAQPTFLAALAVLLGAEPDPAALHAALESAAAAEQL